MRKRYKDMFDYEPGYHVPYVHRQSCGYPDHSLPTHTLHTPSAPVSSSSQGKNSLSKIDRELAAYFHPRRH